MFLKQYLSSKTQEFWEGDPTEAAGIAGVTKDNLFQVPWVQRYCQIQPDAKVFFTNTN